MRRKVRQGATWAAWLGVLALALNAALPVHLAFDLAAALGPGKAAPGHDDGPVAQHEDHHHHHDRDRPSQPAQDHGNACQFCAAAVTLAGFAPAAVVAVPLPLVTAVRLNAPAATWFTLKAAPAAYRSRAPPIA